MSTWRFWRLGPLAVFLLLVCTRMPPVTRYGRFWAEEGRVYFHNAWTLPWHEALVRPEMGYLSLIANVAALAARWLVPLESAPHVTTAIALVVQALPIVILCTASDSWLQRPAPLFAAALLLSLPAGCDEVWLNTPNSQFHLAVAVALCLVLEVPGRRLGRVFRYVLMLLGPLCSPITLALIPLFVARAVLTRDRRRAIYAAFLVAGGIVQFGLFYYGMAGRGSPIGPSTLVSAVMAKNLVLPLVGSQAGEVVVANTRALLEKGIRPLWAYLACLIAIAAVAAAAIIRRRPEPLWLLLAAALVALTSYYGALGPHINLVDATSGNRYAFVPNILLALSVLSITGATLDNIGLAAWALVVWLLAIGFQDYIDPHMPLITTGPSWADGVREWRSKPTLSIPIWPTGWDVKL